MTERRQNHAYLRLLARSCGIATSYIDYRDKRVVLPPEILCGLVSAISGEPVERDSGPEGCRRIYNRIRTEAFECMVPPTIVAWDGKFPKFWLWLPEETKTLLCTLVPDQEGQNVEKEMAVDLKARRRVWDGKTYIRARMDWDSPIPYGYYTFRVRAENGQTGESFLISAPAQLGEMTPRWGAFASAYALKGDHTQGLGGYTELLEAARIVKQNGGEFLGTLPLLPLGYEGAHPEISPYSPLSRLFWNEIFLDVTRLPGPYIANDNDPPPSSKGLVDYGACYAYKKKILLQAAQSYFEAYPEGDEAFQDYLAKNGHLQEYADFRARKYPAQDYEDMRKFHLYVQYACHVQLSRIREEVEAGQAAPLYLDYTVGVHPDGFDAQRMADQFLKGYIVGAPPDWTFVQGQTWGFEPLHPRKLEQSRYQYLRDCFHHYFQYSKIMRIDHVMGLYRLFCVPEGQTAQQGTYIYYNLNAQMGVLCLEAWRHGAHVIGEDLGVVPERIREVMERHKIGRMWIGQNDIRANLKKSFAAITPSMIAALNTHDMFPFTAFMKKFDLEKLYEMDILTDKIFSEFTKERERRIKGLKSAPNAYLAAVEGMAASKAQMVMINMEDLWEETIPQNIPGTTIGHPNWRRQYRKAIGEWTSLPLFQETVEILNRYRMVRP